MAHPIVQSLGWRYLFILHHNSVFLGVFISIRRFRFVLIITYIIYCLGTVIHIILVSFLWRSTEVRTIDGFVEGLLSSLCKHIFEYLKGQCIK